MAQDQVTYGWTAPTTGSPVEDYIVGVKTDEGEWVIQDDPVTEERFTLTIFDEYTYRIRVAPRDAIGRVGPWSNASDMLDHPPGQPGTPGIIEFILGALLLLGLILFGFKRKRD